MPQAAVQACVQFERLNIITATAVPGLVYMPDDGSLHPIDKAGLKQVGATATVIGAFRPQAGTAPH